MYTGVPRMRPICVKAPSLEDDGCNRPSDASGAAPEGLLDRLGVTLTLHGYLRTRYELFHNFALGWDDPTLLASPGNPMGIAPGYYGAGGIADHAG